MKRILSLVLVLIVFSMGLVQANQLNENGQEPREIVKEAMFEKDFSKPSDEPNPGNHDNPDKTQPQGIIKESMFEKDFIKKYNPTGNSDRSTNKGIVLSETTTSKITTKNNVNLIKDGKNFGVLKITGNAIGVFYLNVKGVDFKVEITPYQNTKKIEAVLI